MKNATRTELALEQRGQFAASLIKGGARDRNWLDSGYLDEFSDDSSSTAMYDTADLNDMLPREENLRGTHFDQNVFVSLFVPGAISQPIKWHRVAPKTSTVLSSGYAEAIESNVSHKWKEPLGGIVQELGRLCDGWAGDSTVAPSETIIRALQIISAILPSEAKEPDAEVDPDDGSVGITWFTDRRTESFGLTFFASGKVGGAHAVLNGVALPGWVLPLESLKKIGAQINEPRIARIITW